jgi:hypothetical protein
VRQRHLRLQHHGGFNSVEPAHPHQGASALGGERLGIRERVAVFTQRNRAKSWRQVKLLVIGILMHDEHL